MTSQRVSASFFQNGPHPLRIALIDDVPVFEQHRAIAVVQLDQSMGHPQSGQVASFDQLADQLHQLNLTVRVKQSSRFVQQQNRWLRHQRPGERQRLNLAQSFNPIGSITGVLLSKFFILNNLNTADATTRAGLSPEQLQIIQQQELSAVMGPYVGVALLLAVIWITIAVVKMPKFSELEESIHLGSSLKRLLSNSNYKWGVVAQFFYVGAQIGVWSFTIRYVMAELSLNESGAANYYLAALILFTVARFAFTGLLKLFRGSILLIYSSIVAVIFLLLVIFVGGFVGVIALVGISGCMSLMFPTIFGLASKGLGEDRKIAGSGLIMAILGGAVLTAIQGQISDISGSIHLSFFVPMACFLVVAYFGFSNRKMSIA